MDKELFDNSTGQSRKPYITLSMLYRAGQELGPKGPSSWIEFLFEELLELESSFSN